MIKLFSKCTLGDFEYLSKVLDSTLSFADDKGRSELLEAYRANPCEENKSNLVMKIDHQIRYFASADLAYLFRLVTNENGEVSADEMINDVAEKLKVPVKLIGSTESKLEKIVKVVVENEFFNKSSEELANEFKKFNLEPEKIAEIINEIKKVGKVAVLPILVRIVGKEVVVTIIESIIVGILTKFIGREAAKLLIKELGKRNPIVNALGPIAWTISAIWLALDLQGPAYRKTVPICLYLGIVGMRDSGVEELILEGTA